MSHILGGKVIRTYLLRARRTFEPVLRRALHFYWRLARGLTVGVRALVIDGNGRVLLVRHSYVSGWHLPGGGVEVGETLIDALVRELREEADVALIDPPALHGIFFNRRISRRDHVAVFVVRSFRREGTLVPNREIVDHRFFMLEDLPDDTSPGTRARIAEVLHGASVSEYW